LPSKIVYSISKDSDSLKPIIDALWSLGRKFRDNLPDDKPIERISDNQPDRAALCVARPDAGQPHPAGLWNPSLKEATMVDARVQPATEAPFCGVNLRSNR
jgi:hypothetical protein